MRPTFAGFYVAKRGLDAARANLNITGQNISNVNTIGYTRQRVDLYSLSPSGLNMRYADTNGVYIGEGVNIGGISQLRDPYLDVRYRREYCKVGSTETQLATLTDLEAVFDEITKDGLDAQFSDLVSQLQNLVDKKNDTVAEGVVKNSALMLVKLFNHCSTQVNTIKEQQLEELQDGAITKVNELLSSIAHYNNEIKKANIAGAPALELNDERNMMLDELSSYLNISISTKNVGIGGGVFVEELSVNLLTDSGETFNLIENDDFKKLALAKDGDGNVEEPVKILLQYSDGSPVGGSDRGSISLENGDISSELTNGALYAHLKMLNNGGEFDNPPTTERGIQYYEKMLNTLANEFAKSFNTANSETITTDSNGNPVYDKPWFEANDGSNIITAGNLAISSKWDNTQGSYITATKTDADGNTVDNVLYMISLFSSDVNFSAPETGTPLFKGSFQKCFTQISTVLGLEKKEVQRQNSSYSSVLIDIDNQRASLSSVDVSEEGVNLIQFNQSLQASSRFMTTLDEAVDVIINKMGIVGR